MEITEPQVTPPIAPQHCSEPALRAAIAQTLRAPGLAVDEQVACAAGAADLVTARRDAIYEAKLFLSRKALQQAVGQLMLYRASINPEARMIVVGYPTPETAALRPHIVALGIEVVCWRDEVTGLRTETRIEEQGLRTEGPGLISSALSPQSFAASGLYCPPSTAATTLIKNGSLSCEWKTSFSWFD